MKVSKFSLTITLILLMLTNNIEQGFALRPMAAANFTDGKSTEESIIELRKILIEGLNNDQVNAAQLISEIKSAIAILRSKLALPEAKLTDTQREEIKKILSEITPILFTFGFDKQGNQLNNAFFMASESARAATIRDDIKSQIGTSDLDALARRAASHLMDSFNKNSVAISGLSWRAKSFYSIAAKLGKKGYNVSDMSDLIGIRFYPDIPNATPLEAMHLILCAMPEDWQLLELQRVSYAIENGEYQRLNLQILAIFLWKLEDGKNIKIQLQIRHKNSFTLDSVYNPVYKNQIIPGLPAELTGITELNWKRGEYYYNLEKENPDSVQIALITEIRARWKVAHGKKLLPEEAKLLEVIDSTKRSDFKRIFAEANVDEIAVLFKQLDTNTDIQIPIQYVLSIEETKKHQTKEIDGVLYFIYKKGAIELKFEVRGSKKVGSAKFAILCQRNKAERFACFTDASPKILKQNKSKGVDAVFGVFLPPTFRVTQAVLSAA